MGIYGVFAIYGYTNIWVENILGILIYVFFVFLGGLKVKGTELEAPRIIPNRIPPNHSPWILCNFVAHLAVKSWIFMSRSTSHPKPQMETLQFLLESWGSSHRDQRKTSALGVGRILGYRMIFSSMEWRIWLEIFWIFPMKVSKRNYPNNSIYILISSYFMDRELHYIYLPRYVDGSWS